MLAEDPTTTPTHGKTLKDNGDGTYTINLSVTGETSSSSSSSVTKANVILVVDTSSSMVNNRPDGNGTPTRLALEQEVLTKDNGIIDQLLAQNVAGDAQKKDIIEVAIVGFGMDGEVKQNFTTDSTSLKNSITGLTTDSGTNWEEALQQANGLADAMKIAQPNEKNYILFLTDGQPSVTATNSNIANGTSGWNAAWDAAKDDARDLITDNYELYALFTWGDSRYEHYLTSLVGYAYTGSGSYDSGYGSYGKYYTNADSTETLIAALQQIVNDISTRVGYTGVEMTDGVTTMTASGIKANASGDIRGIKYYRSGGPYSTTANDGLGDEWTDAPKAVINSKGEIDWDLDELVLENGVTYTISFVVWPKQESLDLIANLNNGVVKYEDLSDEEKGQIIKSGNNYTLKTNTDYPTLTYQTITTTTVNGQSTTVTSNPKTINIKNPEPVDLYSEEILLQKLWEDSLDPSQREDDTEIQDIYLQLFKDGEEYDKFHENYDEEHHGIKVEKVPGSNTWTSGSIAIAPGLMVSEGHPAFTEDAPYGIVSYDGKRFAILNPGHDYVFGESDINNHFELTNYIYHPMLVDGKLMNVTFIKSGDTITGVESAKNMSTISATNTIKGGINITKKVVDEEGREISDSKDKFNISVHLLNADGNSGYDYDYRVYCVEAHDDCNQALSNGSGYRSAHIYGNGTITRDIYTTDTIRVVNIDTGTLYYVEENNIPLGYSLDGIDYNIKNYTTEEGQTPQETADKVAKNIDGKDYYAVAGNSSSSAVITNKYVSGNLEVSKTVKVESGNAVTAKDKAFTFTFNLYKDDTKTTELKDVAYKLEGVEGKTSIKSGETFTLKDGDVAKISKLPEGSYYEVTEAAANGYTTTKTGDTGTIAKNETQKADFTNTYSVSGKVKIEVKKDFNDWRTGDNFVFKLNGDGIDQEMTATIDGADKTAEFEIEINDIGTYEYEITEDLSGVRGGIARMSNDIIASVTATDNSEGGLNFDVSYKGGDGEKLNTIVNRYNANGNIRLGASKILTGRDWQEGELYTFTLIGPDGKEIESRDVSKAQPDVVYSEINYTLEDAGKTFVYTIHESTPLPGGVTNSGDVTATVTVEDNHDGTLKTTVVYTGGQGEKYNTIVNTYSAEGLFNFEATKVLEGREWQSGESYSFVLKDEDNNVVDTQTVDKNHTTVNFKKLKFTQADEGEHKYTITETGTMPNGLSKSEDIDVTLTVTDDKKGNLSFVADYSNNGTITNTYEATGEVQLEATKVLEGRDWRENESFEFELSGDGIRNPETITVTKENPTAKFEKIKYNQADASKTYVYTIKETTDLTGMSMENSGDITVTVKLADDGEGGIVPDVTYSKEDKVIKNIYSASGDVTLSVEKKLEGRDWKDGESYEFALKDADGYVIDTQTISKDGTVAFKKINYTKIGTYNYTIEETTEMSNGMSNSGAINVSVEVTDNYDGTLTATPTYKDNNKTIVNTYSASGKAQLEATKVLEGRDWKDGESFTFELFKGDESLGRKTVTKDSPKAIFDEIKYTEADIDAEYVYTIEEVSTLPNSMTSSGDLTVYVNVSDNGDGTLNVVTDYRNGGTITNTYEANGKAQLEVTKELVGRDWLDSDEFTFELSGEGIETQTKTVKKGQEKAVFDAIKYTEADAGKSYTYTIKETTDLNGLSMTNSGSITATVKVVDNGDGNLATEVSYTNSGKITNTYTAKGEVELQATKELVGRDWLEGESYDFVLSGKDGEIDRQAVDANETVTFKKINYTEADAGKTYTYTIAEDGELKAGITKSGDISVTVKLTDDNKGRISAEVSYTNGDKITNTYETKPVEVEKPFTVKKKIDDQSNSKKDASFKFELLDDKNAAVQTKEVSTKDLVGSVDFDAIKFDKAGTYKYTLVETNDGQAGFSYDTAKHAVVIEVTDNYEKAQLVAKVTIDGKEVSEVEFVNTYKAEDTSTKINLEKVLSGIDQNLAKEFEFVLSDKDGEIQTVKIKGSGKAEFDEIKFEKVGEYTYTVKEVKGNAKGYTYDESEYTVTVNVSDEDAKLKAEISYQKDGAEADAIIFENSYKPEDVIYGCLDCKVPIAVKKVLEKRDLKDKEFKFNVYLGGELVATGYNTANGKIVLDKGITLNEAGKYNFVIKEDTTEREQDITYDESEYTFIVEVEDTGEGELKVVSDTSSNITFTNKYNEPGRGNTPPKTPYTYDGIMTSVATLAISLIGLVGSLFAGKRYLKKEK